MTKRRPLALGAAAAIGFGSLFFATPALAEENPDTAKNTEISEVQETPAPETSPETATADVPATEEPEAAISTDQIIDSAHAFQAATGELPVAAGANSANELVILADKDAKTEEVLAYAEAAENGEVQGVSQILFGAKAIAYADTDVVGGAGYMMVDGQNAYACSVGFSAWGPERVPAVLSAGHCTSDGARSATLLSQPSVEPAVGGEGYVPSDAGALGNFGFYRFGGPGNTNGTENDPTSTDISVIDVTNNALTTLPEVTDWSTASSDDLSEGTIPVYGVADPASGEVSKSGRTTGFTSGDTTVMLEDGAGNPVPGEILDGYLQIDGRWVHGFVSDAVGAPGDSGGAVIQGNNAVGLVSGGPEDGSWMWATRLQDALEYTGGYEVALDIDAPVVTSPANNGHVQPGTEITGTVPANATELTISTAPNSGESIPVSGSFSLTAPSEPGTYTYSLTATNGMSRSETTEHVVVVDELALAAPGVNDVDSEGPKVTLSGTGVAGAEINGDVTAAAAVARAAGVPFSATVGTDGTWSAEVELEAGTYAISATQTVGDQTSPAGTADLTVRPVAPVITSIAEGSAFAAEKAPTTISGTGIDGATISLALGNEAFSATVENGEWTVDFGGALAAGDYSAVAVQTVNEVNSAASGVNFSVLAAPAGPGAPTAPGNDGDLATTGGAPLMPLGIAAFAMLLVGGGVTLAMARRKKATEV